MELRTARSKLCQPHTCQPSHISLQGRKNREINSGHSLNEIRTGRICFLNASAPRRRERTTRGETLGDSQRPERGREQHPGERKALFFPSKRANLVYFHTSSSLSQLFIPQWAEFNLQPSPGASPRIPSSFPALLVFPSLPSLAAPPGRAHAH